MCSFNTKYDLYGSVSGPKRAHKNCHAGGPGPPVRSLQRRPAAAIKNDRPVVDGLVEGVHGDDEDDGPGGAGLRSSEMGSGRSCRLGWPPVPSVMMCSPPARPDIFQI